MPPKIERRNAIKRIVQIPLLMASAPLISTCGGGTPPSVSVSVDSPPIMPLLKVDEFAVLQPLNVPDVNGVMLPPGYTSRVVAISGEPVLDSSGYLWHDAPDGGAVFETSDGGWIYVSNSELPNGNGGVGAIRFDSAGQIVDSYSILTGTSRNCAGGATPWRTWLSCEENQELGRVFECDPTGTLPAVEVPALGRFNHEAVAVDPDNAVLYLTEDQNDGLFYRFVPDTLTSEGHPNLASGTLQAALIVDESNGQIEWQNIPDPQAVSTPTRKQLDQVSEFRGGEGIDYSNGHIYFTTKFDNRVWDYAVQSQQISVYYGATSALNPILTGVDNLKVSTLGNILVAEDGGDMQIVVLNPSGDLLPLLQLDGHASSEIAGPALSPDGTRLYFSSQRGLEGPSDIGITFEISRTANP